MSSSKGGSDLLDRIPMPTDPTRSLGQWLTGALTGSPDGDGPVIPGVKNLPHDTLSGKNSQTINDMAFPRDERYAGPMRWAEFASREAQVEQTVFSIEQAQGQNPCRHLCRVCRRIGVVAGNGLSDKHWIKWRAFGTWAGLLCRARHCVFCRVVLHSLSDGTKRRLHPRLAKIDPEIGSVQLYPEQLPSGERYLAVEYGYRRAGAIRMLRQDNYPGLLRQAYETPGRELRDLLQDSGSPIRSASGQCVSIRLIRSWLSECETKHGQKCAVLGPSAPSSSAPTPMNILLVDVHNHCLVRTTASKRYFALSYVWGNIPMPKTMRANLTARMKPGSLPHDLPATIRDAMTLIRNLGERYLWTDVLCIVQDDAQQKHRDIKQMDLVYSCAAATIVGLHGQNADAGLPGIRPGTRKPQVFETTRTMATGFPEPDPEFIQLFDHLSRTDKEKHEALTICHTIGIPLGEGYDMMKWLVDVLEPGGPGNPRLDGRFGTGEPHPFIPDFFAMVPHPPALEYALRCSNWNTRGWTFQERHLSRRCIYFSSDFVYFQCGESTRCETGGDLLPWLDITPTTGYSSRAEALRKVEMNPLLYLPTCASPDPLSFQENPNPVDHYVYKRHRFDVYQEIVEAYSRRQLSFVADALNAFAGVGRVLERAFDCSILSGLPACYLDHALIWAHEGAWTRRVLPDSSHDNQDGLSTKVFPSWSWAGWTGSMQYLLLTKGEDTYRRENHEYARSEIECFQIFHSGELHEIFKDKARMNAVLTRNFGSYSQKPILKTYPIYLGYEERKTQGIQGPDFGPDALQFWTEAVRDDAFTLTQLGHGHLIADREHGNVVGEQGVIKMLDGAKTHCGLMLSFHSKDTRTWHKPTRGRLEWILVSSFGDAHDRRSGLKTVDTEVHSFDERKLPYKGPGSGLVNVMLIEWDDEVAERLTVAQVHRQAWEAAGPERKHIRLI